MAAPSLSTIPPEVVHHICSHMEASSLSRTRLVNHYLGNVATSWLFWKVEINTNSYRQCLAFTKIAQSAKLSPLVRQVVCTTCVPMSMSDFPHLDDGFYAELRNLRRLDVCTIANIMSTLPFIACFRNLRNLEVSFRDLLEPEVPPHVNLDNISFESGFIELTLQCLAGTWSLQRQKVIDEALWQETHAEYSCSQILPSTSGPIALKVFKLREMNEELDPRVAESAEFKTIIGSGTLVDLSLHKERYTSIGGRGPITASSRHQIERFERLPKVWFIPDVAKNLQALSLTFGHSWGWHPKVNLETISPSFPNLRDLTLGKFIFNHERQAEWIASLGKSNRSGGLERLCLHTCRILYVATHVGYPNEENMMAIPPPHAAELCTHFPLRWYTVFEKWQQSMPALTLFQLNDCTDGEDYILNSGPRPKRDILGYATFRQNDETKYHTIPKNHVGVPYGEAAFALRLEQLKTNPPIPVGPCVVRDEQATTRFCSLVKSRKESAMAQQR
ncbi:hypothetical protein EDB81DRAFT_884388 [Dactylonectria macrodidyma]|uniref:F-box domain-containing protein n=1 Tax=Dactylonectria macrodidyma TaxID=307937 RepID=A0A9P9J4L6_9HYPO|nr:hypothetical protein EDB81DRAFT_884388 [Dactylonectria macrodidyma]